MADAPKHDWKFQFREHNEQKHWYTCSICGAIDWLAGDKTVAQMLPTECKPVEVAVEKPTETMLQPKITGYRQLSEEEVALMNEGKELAEQVGKYLTKLRFYTPTPAEGKHTNVPGAALDQRWISIGATDIQKGFMSVMRGIAQPTTF